MCLLNKRTVIRFPYFFLLHFYLIILYFFCILNISFIFLLLFLVLQGKVRLYDTCTFSTILGLIKKQAFIFSLDFNWKHLILPEPPRSIARLMLRFSIASKFAHNITWQVLIDCSAWHLLCQASNALFHEETAAMSSSFYSVTEFPKKNVTTFVCSDWAQNLLFVELKQRGIFCCRPWWYRGNVLASRPKVRWFFLLFSFSSYSLL